MAITKMVLVFLLIIELQKGYKKSADDKKKELEGRKRIIEDYKNRSIIKR